MTDSGSDQGPIDRVDEKYLIDSDSDIAEYQPEGGREVEMAYKLALTDSSKGDDRLNKALEHLTLTRLYNQIVKEENKRDQVREDLLEEYGDLDDQQEDLIESVYRIEVTDNVILFYILDNELISALASDLLAERFFDERDDGIEDTLGDIKQDKLADMLYHGEVVSKKVKDDIINANKTRNKLVHQFRDRHYAEALQDILPMVERTTNVIDELYYELDGFRPFD